MTGLFCTYISIQRTSMQPAFYKEGWPALKILKAAAHKFENTTGDIDDLELTTDHLHSAEPDSDQCDDSSSDNELDNVKSNS